MTTQANVNCPTFINLAAATAGLPEQESDDPFGSSATLLPVRAGDCEVFVADLSAGDGLFLEERGDTWIFALMGACSLIFEGQEVSLAQGESLVILRGTEFGWRAKASARLLGMRYLKAPKGKGGFQPIDNAGPLSPSNPPADDVLLSEQPACRSGNQFASADGVFKCGIWDSTPYRRLPIHFHHSELMHLLAGSVTFTDAAGRTATFREGDTFIIEKGADCSWDSEEYVSKIYAYYRP